MACSSTDRECAYDTLGDGESRSSALKRENTDLRSEVARLGGTLDILLSLPEAEAPDYIAFLRSQGVASPSSLATHAKDDSTRSRRGFAFPLEDVEMQLVDGKKTSDFALDVPNGGFEHNSHGLYYARLRGLRVNHWTAVPVSDDVAGFAISSYLAARQDFFGYLDVDRFLTDLLALRTHHCSPMLVNALLFRACVSAALIVMSTTPSTRTLLRAESSSTTDIHPSNYLSRPTFQAWCLRSAIVSSSRRRRWRAKSVP